MPTAYARTDGAGRMVTFASLRPLTKEEMYGEKIDPWSYVSKVSPGKARPLYEFFAEDKFGDLLFRELDKYNLLLCHALRELNLDRTSELLVHACAANGAKQIKIQNHYFLLSGGKIYRRGK